MQVAAVQSRVARAHHHNTAAPEQDCEISRSHDCSGQDTSLSYRLPPASRKASALARTGSEWASGARCKMLLLNQGSGMALLQPGAHRHVAYLDLATGTPVVDFTFKARTPGRALLGPACTHVVVNGLKATACDLKLCCILGSTHHPLDNFHQPAT